MKKAEAKTIKRAIAISGGGPPVGIAIGALKALQEEDIKFDVLSGSCIGAWVSVCYALGGYEKAQLFESHNFLIDKIYQNFPVNAHIFQPDYPMLMKAFFDRLMSPDLYKYLWLPDLMQALYEYQKEVPPESNEDRSMYLTHWLMLNPVLRFMTDLQYNLALPGKSKLGGWNNKAVNKWMDFEALYNLPEFIYINAYNKTKQQLEVFVNRKDHPKYQPITADSLTAGSSIPNYAMPYPMNGDIYCEGAIVDTVNFKDLVENHPDLDEVWVIRILDRSQAPMPTTLIEAELQSTMLLFETIAEDDIKLFKYHLKEDGRDIKVIEMYVSHKEVNYHWNQSNYTAGIKAGYEGAKQTITKYKNNEL